MPWFTSDEYTRSLDAVCERLHVNRDHNRVSHREQILDRGLRALGWHVDAMPRNVAGCDQGKVCGYCGYGCILGAKQSSTKTWLADAQQHGARFVVDTRALRVRIKAGSATGVEARSKRGHRVRIRCKAVISACGSLHTPALFLRSGLRNENIGRHLHLHPVSNVCGVFEEEIRPWEGTMQAIYSDEHRFLTGNFGVKYETTALQPVIGVAVLPWRDPAQYRSLLAKLSHISAIGVLLRDRETAAHPESLGCDLEAGRGLLPFILVAVHLVHDIFHQIKGKIAISRSNIMVGDRNNAISQRSESQPKRGRSRLDTCIRAAALS